MNIGRQPYLSPSASVTNLSFSSSLSNNKVGKDESEFEIIAVVDVWSNFSFLNSILSMNNGYGRYAAITAIISDFVLIFIGSNGCNYVE